MTAQEFIGQVAKEVIHQNLVGTQANDFIDDAYAHKYNSTNLDLEVFRALVRLEVASIIRQEVEDRKHQLENEIYSND